MDNKTWLWKKKTSEKTIVVTDKVSVPYKENGEENEPDKALELQRAVKSLNEKLASTLSESNAKDELVNQHIKVAEEAIAGWGKAEAATLSLKEELDNALQQRVALEGRIVHLDAALKERTRQLHHVREEQEKSIHGAIMKVSRDLDKARINFDEKVAESGRKIAELGASNSQLSKILQVKEKLIEDLTERKTQADVDSNALLRRLDLSEKDNASLKYEVCMLAKELEIRNKEREFNRIAADASQKQHQESMKKVAKLETECQRLRLLVRKRLPGPAALAQMKNEVESLGRKKLDPAMASLALRGCVSNNIQEASGKKISFLTERLCSVEEENKILKEALAKKNGELQSSRVMCARTVSKLSQVESQLGKLSTGNTCLELARTTSVSYDLSLASISEDRDNEDEVSCAESWASALISELEHFRNGKPKATSCGSVGASELSLMDDFVEMERLAIVPLDKPLESFDLYSKEDKRFTDSPSKSDPSLSPTNVTGKELVPIGDGHLDFHYENLDTQSKKLPVEKSPSWLQDVLRVVLRNHVSQNSVDEILEEVKIMTNFHYPPNEAIEVGKSSSHSHALDQSTIVTWKSPLTSAEEDQADGENGLHTPLKQKNNQSFSSRLNQSICKVIELIERISQPSLTGYNNHQIVLENDSNTRPYKDSTMFTMRAFQWQSSELNSFLQHFAHTCNNFLQGNADLDDFAVELSTTLGRVVNHCFSLQDVSSIKDTIKNHFNCDESCNGSELQSGGMNSLKLQVGKFNASEEHNLTNEASPDGQYLFTPRAENEFKLKDENRRLKDEILETKLEKKDLEEILQSATNSNESLKLQLQESEQCISNLQMELTAAKISKRLIEEQIENYKLINEDFDTQLAVARVELNEARQKFSSLEVHLEEKGNLCEELEATCLELQLRLESVENKETSKDDVDEEEKRRRTDWEISAATEKLAECQETILSLGKQLKALASPMDPPLLDKVIPAATTTNHRPSLLDQLLAEDEAKSEELKSPKTKEIICTGDPPKTINGWKVSKAHDAGKLVNSGYQASPVKSPGRYFGLNETRKHDGRGPAGALAIVPKKQGSSFFRKLLLRKRGSSKKTLAITS